MSTYARLAELPLEIESYELEGLEREVSSDFVRLTTLIRLRGGGHEGVGEDVTYTALDQIGFQDAGRRLPLAGAYDIESFSRLVERLDLWSAPPEIEVSSLYRRWAFESAALDLALRQAGRSLPQALEREPGPLEFVVSLRLGDPASTEPLRRRLDASPGLRFKLDATPDWDDELIAALVETGAVDTVDFKGAYKGTSVDQPGDPDLYARVAAAFPDAWLEDPDLNPETEAALADHRDRITWDVPVHSVADVEAFPFRPRMVNLKPSRFGPLRGCARRTTTAQRTASAPTAGASSSSARAAARSRPWPPSSTPTPRTTWPPAATTTSSRRPGCPRARSSRGWRRRGSAGRRVSAGRAAPRPRSR